MRLIDADDLKEEVNKKKVVGHFNVLSLVDAAPTVAVNCKDCDGYEAGYSAGLKDAERSKGEWIEFAHWVAKEVLDDYFKEKSDSFAEVACRKLVKLGLVELKDNVYKMKGGAE